jgi:hypothetical protein
VHRRDVELAVLDGLAERRPHRLLAMFLEQGVETFDVLVAALWGAMDERGHEPRGWRAEVEVLLSLLVEPRPRAVHRGDLLGSMLGQRRGWVSGLAAYVLGLEATRDEVSTPT